jgi:hypothetical protein
MKDTENVSYSSSAADMAPSSYKSKRSVAGLLPTGTASPEYCRATKQLPGAPNATEAQFTVPAACARMIKTQVVEAMPDMAMRV